MYRFISIAVLVLGTSVAPVAHAALPLVLPGGAGEADVALPSLADMLERTNPAVVNIATRTTVVESAIVYLRIPFFGGFLIFQRAVAVIAALRARAPAWS